MIEAGAMLLQNQPSKHKQSRKQVDIFESMILALKVYFLFSLLTRII